MSLTLTPVSSRAQIPLLFFVLLYLQRDKIKRVMEVKMALEDIDASEADKLTDSYYRAKSDTVAEISIHKVAIRDSLRRRSGDYDSPLKPVNEGNVEIKSPERSPSGRRPL